MVDSGKPLGKGLSSRLQIIGGEVIYEEHAGNHPLFQESSVNGLRLPVVGGSVSRTEDGRIVGRVEISKPAPILFVGEGGAADAYDFFSASEYISDEPQHPTIFQNLITQVTPAGRQINFPGVGRFPMPFELSVSSFTEAVGYVADGKFVGTMRLSYDLEVSKMGPQIRQLLAQRFGHIPDTGHMTGAGRFEVSLLQSP